MGYVIAHGTDLFLSQQAANIEYEMMLLSEEQQMLSQQAAQVMGDYNTSSNSGNSESDGTATTNYSQPDAYTKLAEFQSKEKALEAQMQVLETQHSAIVQNMEATEKLVEENVKKSAAWT